MTPSDDLTDLADELVHDLGKHMVLPIALVPRDADASTVAGAVGRALFRRHGGAVEAVEVIWARTRGQFEGLSSLPACDAAIAAAVAWRGRDIAAGDQARLLDDCRAVAVALRALRREVGDG